MQNIMQLVSMQGYGNYVWSAYGVAFLVLLLQVKWVKKQTKTIRAQLIKGFKSRS